jgi:hypothetical protein
MTSQALTETNPADAEEAMRQYLELMRGPSAWTIPPALKASLREARTARQDARAVLERADTLVRHAGDVWSNKKDLLRAATVTAAANADVDQAIRLERLRRDAEVVCEAAERALKAAHSAQASRRNALSAAQEQVGAAKAQIYRTHLEDLVGRLRQLRDQEYEICCLLGAARLRGISTGSAEGALDAPPPRPTSQITLPHPGIALDINTPIGGDARALEAAQRHWREFDAVLERDGVSSDADHERAA